MAEAVVSTAWGAIEKAKEAPVKPPPNEMPSIPRDPLTSFENMVGSLKADLANWMTFDKKGRMDRVAWWKDTYTDTALRVTPDRRHKVLCFIIFMESHHPLGDSQVAGVAFNALFPGHIGKKKGKEEN